MLYTVSAVQIIATLDAFDDLDAHVKDGRRKIAQCTQILETGATAHFGTS